MSWSAIDSWLGIIVYSELQVNPASKIWETEAYKVEMSWNAIFSPGIGFVYIKVAKFC